MHDIWYKPITTKTFLLYAASHYKNGKSTWFDFYDDVRIISKLSKSLHQYIDRNMPDQMKARCVLNYVIMLGNVFQHDSLARILFFKLASDLHPYVKSMLKYLYRLPKSIPEIDINTIEENKLILNVLKLD